MNGTNRLINQMKLQSSVGDSYANPIVGTVSSYDPDNYCCKVTIQEADPESGLREMISGWIPVGTIWVGNGWGLFCPPSIGDMVEIDFQESNFRAGHVDWRFYNDEDRPVRAESGVFYIIHKSGTSLKFENDGSVKLSNKDAKEFIKIQDGKVQVNSGTEVDLGNVGGSLCKLVTETFMQLFNNHTHPVVGVQGGSSTVPSQKTTSPMTDAHLTSIVKAN